MRGVAVLGFATALGACSATHLVYVQEANLGLTIAAGTEGSNKLSFGYDRDVYAIVPKKGDDQDAMSLFSLNKSKVSGLNSIDVSEFVAGGTPATKIAEKPNAVEALRKKIYGE